MIKNRWYLQKLAAPLTNLPITETHPLKSSIFSNASRRAADGKRQGKTKRDRQRLSARHHDIRATNDPTFPLRGALLKPNVQHRPAITDEAKLGALLAAIDEYDGWPTSGGTTTHRPDHDPADRTTLMRRSEIVVAQAVWRIPAERMRMRRPHDVPLSQQALTVIRDIWPLSEHQELVLPSIRSPLKPFVRECDEHGTAPDGLHQGRSLLPRIPLLSRTTLKSAATTAIIIEAPRPSGEDEVRATSQSREILAAADQDECRIGRISRPVQEPVSGHQTSPNSAGPAHSAGQLSYPCAPLFQLNSTMRTIFPAFPILGTVNKTIRITISIALLVYFVTMM